MNEFLTAKELITILIAAYGAVLSTFIFYREQQKNKRKVKVNLTIGYLTSDRGLSNCMVLLEFVNPGFKTVTINSPELNIPDGRKIIVPNPNSNVAFPHSLEEGKSAHVWLDIEGLQKELLQAGYKDTIKLQGAVSDQTGKKFKSKNWMKISLQRSYNN